MAQKKLNSNSKLKDLLDMEDSMEKLQLLIKKQSRLWEGKNSWACMEEIHRLAQKFNLTPEQVRNM